jgi:galactoside O-acetyltransferase
MDSIVHARIDFDSAQGSVTVGDRTYIGASHIVCHTKVALGDDVMISWGVTIVDHDSHALNAAARRDDVLLWAQGRKSWAGVKISPVNIGSRAWIGFGATILKGVTVGEGAVIGAKSVVTRDVPPYCVVAGNPARVVRELSKDL